MRLIHLLAGAAILIGAAFATNLIWKSEPSHASGDAKMMRTITVTGEGQVFAAPDQATINAGVVTDGPTAKDALARNSARMTEVIAALKKMGIESKDIQTSGFNLSPMYLPQPPGQTVPRIGGYQVSNNVTVTVKDLAKLGEIMDQVVQMGSNSVGGVSFSIANPKPLMMQAREAAIGDAKMRAEAYAKAAGVSVGKVAMISEVAAPIVQPAPIYAMRAAAADSSAVPVESGQQQLSLTVTVVFDID
jgi:uncharacterized protein